ncbi:MAG TPA: acyl carrier protein [Bacillota bacterium]|nr:acyl carrier protein [Bacillota bacterium]HPE38487.1 acyl carrier protein [Bacillota bacterium]
MTPEKILARLSEIACEVFDEDDLVFTMETTAQDVEDWDSLTHLSFVNEIENVYGIKMTMGEIQGAKNVGDFVETILKHIG